MQINPFELLKNVQKLQEQMGDMQQKLEAVGATGSAGGGMVEIDLNGLFELQAIRIAPELMNERDKNMLESLIVAAFTDARDKVKEVIGREMGGLTGMPNLSSLFAGMT
ncbi:MAG: YbaB/EbfC family nucleoid-associated protein [Treponema sp.]|jgi:DNA-binding YbaB/EbfC family protein|nr:YbaB/EbfC family nucleoid-associated protein [Treponema sp.]